MNINRSDVIEWLLAAKTPSIRYVTLRQILKRDEADNEVQGARHEIMEIGPVPTILKGQTMDGNWSPEQSYYTPKYSSTHWSMLLLAELHADGQEERMRRGADYMLTATEKYLANSFEKGGVGVLCFWGNLLRYALHCELADDSRLRNIVRYLEHNALVEGWRCLHNNGLPCAWGVARMLWGMANIPADSRSTNTNISINLGLDFLLSSHHLIDADYPTPGRIHPLWFRLNFPLFYQADTLFVLRVISELGAVDYLGARSAVEWLSSRRKGNGRWRGASPFRRRTWSGLSDREETDRWVSLYATIILDQVFS